MNDEVIRVLIDETIARAMARHRGVRLCPGTVIDATDQTVVRVNVDGDDQAPLEEQPPDGVYVRPLACPVRVGDRVMVAFYPPSGAVLIGEIVDMTWKSVGAAGQPAFENSWVNFGAPNQDAQFRREPGGILRLRGLVKSGVIGNTVFTLPTDLRPPADLHYATASNALYGTLKVGANGQVIAQTGSNVYFALNIAIALG